MSLDVTSHPVRSGPTSWFRRGYALRVGEIDVMVVSDGVAIAARRDVGPQTPDPAMRAAWLSDMFLPAGRARVGAERGRGA